MTLRRRAGPRHRRRRVHRQPPRRAARRGRRARPGLLPLQLARLAGAGSTRPTRRSGRRSTSGSATSATPRFVAEATEGVEVVFHLAALIAIPYSYAAPESFVDTNVRRHAQRARRRPPGGRPPAGHTTSTSEVYGTPATLPITRGRTRSTRSRRTRPRKVAADQLALAYHRSFGLPVVVLRPFNTYGPAPVGAGGPADDAPPAARRSDGGPARAARPAARPDLSSPTRSTGSSGRPTAPGIDGVTIQLGTGRSRVDRRAVRARLPAPRRHGPAGRGGRPACAPTRARCSSSSPTRRAPGRCSAGRPRRASRTASGARSTGCVATPSPTWIVSSSEDRTGTRRT